MSTHGTVVKYYHLLEPDIMMDKNREELLPAGWLELQADSRGFCCGRIPLKWNQVIRIEKTCDMSKAGSDPIESAREST